MQHLDWSMNGSFGPFAGIYILIAEGSVTDLSKLGGFSLVHRVLDASALSLQCKTLLILLFVREGLKPTNGFAS